MANNAARRGDVRTPAAHAALGQPSRVIRHSASSMSVMSSVALSAAVSCSISGIAELVQFCDQLQHETCWERREKFGETWNGRPRFGRSGRWDGSRLQGMRFRRKASATAWGRLRTPSFFPAHFSDGCGPCSTPSRSASATSRVRAPVEVQRKTAISRGVEPRGTFLCALGTRTDHFLQT